MVAHELDFELKKSPFPRKNSIPTKLKGGNYNDVVKEVLSTWEKPSEFFNTLKDSDILWIKHFDEPLSKLIDIKEGDKTLWDKTMESLDYATKLKHLMGEDKLELMEAILHQHIEPEMFNNKLEHDTYYNNLELNKNIVDIIKNAKLIENVYNNNFEHIKPTSSWKVNKEIELSKDDALRLTLYDINETFYEASIVFVSDQLVSDKPSVVNDKFKELISLREEVLEFKKRDDPFLRNNEKVREVYPDVYNFKETQDRLELIGYSKKDAITLMGPNNKNIDNYYKVKLRPCDLVGRKPPLKEQIEYIQVDQEQFQEYDRER